MNATTAKMPSRTNNATNRRLKTTLYDRQREQIRELGTKGKTIDYLCILDFEATCQARGIPSPQEIIEFPTLLVDANSGEIVDTFHYYIKPAVHPKLSKFCIELTGIEQETVDRGISLLEALRAHKTWLKDNHDLVPFFLEKNTENRKTFVYVTCGDWDLQTCLPNQMTYLNETVPWFFERWINLKPAFQDFKGRTNSRIGMVGMLRSLNMKLIGRHHSGIDDCKNLARICKHMINHGWRPTTEMASAETTENAEPLTLGNFMLGGRTR